MILETHLPKLFGKNLKSTPKEVIIDQLNEPRPLPMGRQDFDEWAERIIAGALIPNEAGKVFQVVKSEEDKFDYEVFKNSQKFCLANMLMHLSPTESHKPDAFFIHSLRKFAVNQVADNVRREIHEAAKARLAEEEEKKKQELAAVTEDKPNVISIVTGMES
jgi:hypothetical protein